MDRGSTRCVLCVAITVVILVVSFQFFYLINSTSASVPAETPVLSSNAGGSDQFLALQNQFNQLTSEWFGEPGEEPLSAKTFQDIEMKRKSREKRLKLIESQVQRMVEIVKNNQLTSANVQSTPVAPIQAPNPPPVPQPAPVAQEEESHRGRLNKDQIQMMEERKARNARGLDFSKRVKALPATPNVKVERSDIYAKKRKWGSLADLVIDTESKIALCTIEKVASSEWRKLLHRLRGDHDWRREPWYKDGYLHRIRQAQHRDSAHDIMNDPEWVRMVFFRHPYERLISCYYDKFGRPESKSKSYSLTISNGEKENITFDEFVDIITHPDNKFHNSHWRPQHRFCGLAEFFPQFNFVGNFENLEEHGQYFLQVSDLWDIIGSDGWGKDKNMSMFQRNNAKHQTGKSKRGTIDDYLPIGSPRREAVYRYYEEDFKMFASIHTPPFIRQKYVEEVQRYS